MITIFSRCNVRAAKRNARKRKPPSETKTMIMTVEWCSGDGGGVGMICGGGGGEK